MRGCKYPKTLTLGPKGLKNRPGKGLSLKFDLLFLATPADASLLMQLGVDGCFVGSGIFKSDNPEHRAKAMVEAVAHYNDPKKLAEVSENLGEAMVRSS